MLPTMLFTQYPVYRTETVEISSNRTLTFFGVLLGLALSSMERVQFINFINKLHFQTKFKQFPLHLSFNLAGKVRFPSSSVASST